MKTVYVCSLLRRPWWRHFPGEEKIWGRYRFIFDGRNRTYDYLVIYDVPPRLIRRRCPAENVIHVGTEPNLTGQHYDRRYTDQFACCITIDPELRHPAAVHGQPGLPWFIGLKGGTFSGEANLGWNELCGLFDEPRTKLLSVIASNHSSNPGHRKRFAFAKALKEHFKDRLDFYGRGWQSIDDKLEVLRGYRFHIAIENSSFPHYFSEKLSDPLIAGCQPIYWGCPNAADYFPKEALIDIDIDDVSGSIARIEKAIAGNEDQQRLEARRTARDKVFYEHNLFALLSRQIDAMEASTIKTKPPTRNLVSRLGWIRPNIFGIKPLCYRTLFLLGVLDVVMPLYNFIKAKGRPTRRDAAHPPSTRSTPS